MKRYLLYVFFLSVFSISTQGQNKPVLAGDRVAVDGLNRKIGGSEMYGPARSGKTVGIFYFLWLGAHGFDQATTPLPDQGVMTPTAADSLSPYNITELLKQRPDHPGYGPAQAFHHWGEPYFGYYLTNDEWVIRKHGQMLSDAGVDVMILDVTNAILYLPQVKTLCETFTRMREEGNKTPQIAFILHASPETTLKRLYDEFYARELYPDLWFRWKGRPLILCPPEGLTPETADFFTVRDSWFCSSWPWFGDGKDKWTWADLYPQKPGWHESPEIPEAISVCAATHPHTNIGRSFHNGRQPDSSGFKSKEGLFFAEQISQALKIDPEFVFITGWNEWVAQRFTDGAAGEMTGKKIQKGATYFVDQYNEEYSRDIEPAKGLLGDHFYYQMTDFIRRFKGVSPSPAYSTLHKIRTDGGFDDWEQVQPVFTDDRGDILHRNHPGWGRIGNYCDTSGRNDIIRCKIARTQKSLCFYVETAGPLTPCVGGDWMRLLLAVGDNDGPAWEGFGYKVEYDPSDACKARLYVCTGGWSWRKDIPLKCRWKNNRMELEIPLSALGIDSQYFTIDFKWTDHVPLSEGIETCLDRGDSAPNARFRYRFVFNKQPE